MYYYGEGDHVALGCVLAIGYSLLMVVLSLNTPLLLSPLNIRPPMWYVCTYLLWDAPLLMVSMHDGRAPYIYCHVVD